MRLVTARLLMAGMAASGASASATDWRNGGTGVTVTASVPSDWTAQVAWTRSLDAWSNASPAPHGEWVCTTSEPVTLVCFDQRSGEEVHRSQHPVIGVLEADQRRGLAPRLAKVPAMIEEMASARSEIGRLRRELRAGKAVSSDGLTALSDRVFAIQDELTDLDAYRHDVDRELIGFATPTPASDDGRLYAMFGNGVVVAIDRQGEEVWSRWLGPGESKMRGYTFGSTASPRLHGGVLVVAHGALTGLDPQTGEVLWQRNERYMDYGTPASVQIDGLFGVVTPDGRLIDVSDGRQVASGLGDVVHTSPLAVGDRVYFVGGRDEEMRRRGGVPATAVQLSLQGNLVEVTALWDVVLPMTARIYASPTWFAGRVWIVTAEGELMGLSASDGDLDLRQTLSVRSDVFNSPMVVGDRMWVGVPSGFTVGINEKGEIGTGFSMDPYRSSPAAWGGSVWVRSLEGLTRFGG